MPLIRLAAALVRSLFLLRSVLLLENAALRHPLSVLNRTAKRPRLGNPVGPSGPHQSLDHSAPLPLSIEPPEQGKVVAEPVLGGLHHRDRRAA